MFSRHMVDRPIFAAALLALFLVAPAAAQLTEAQRSVLADFEKYMRSKDASERVGQVEALAFVDGVESTRMLLEIGLIDKDARVRYRAAWALSRKEIPAAVTAIKSVGLAHKNALVREGAARALGKMEGDEHLAALADALKSERKAPVQIALLKALGAHETHQGADAAARLVTQRHQGVALAAIDFLGDAKLGRHAATLHPLLQHKAWQIQAATLAALGKIRHRSSVPLVIEFMGNTRGRLRGDARDCLMAITGNQFGFKAEQWQKWWDTVKGDSTSRSCLIPVAFSSVFAPPFV